MANDMKQTRVMAILAGTCLAAGTLAFSIGCEEKKAEPAKAITEGANKAVEAAKETGTKVAEGAAAATEQTKEAAAGAAAGATEKAAEMAKVAMEKLDSGLKTARSALDEMKKKADGASPMVKPIVTPMLEKAETTYASLADKVKGLAGMTDAGAKEKAMGEAGSGLDSLNKMLGDIKSKLGM